MVLPCSQESLDHPMAASQVLWHRCIYHPAWHFFFLLSANILGKQYHLCNFNELICHRKHTSLSIRLFPFWNSLASLYMYICMLTSSPPVPLYRLPPTQSLFSVGNSTGCTVLFTGHRAHAEFFPLNTDS